MIRVEHIEDLLQRGAPPRVYLQEWRPGLRLAEIIPEGIGAHIVSLDREPVRAAQVDTLELQDGATVEVAEVPGFFVALLPASAAASTILLAAVADFIVGLAVSAAISYGIAALNNPPRLGGRRETDSASRSFEGIQNTVGAGAPIPFILGGPIRVGGHIVQSFERAASAQEEEDGITTLYTQISYGVGPIEAIEELKIDGNAESDLEDVVIHRRLGGTEEGPIPGFEEVVAAELYQRPILRADGFVTFQSKREVDGLEVVLRFPAGLRKVSSTGSVQTEDVIFRIELEPVGGVGSYEARDHTVSSRRNTPVKSIVRFEGLERAAYVVRVRRLTLDDSERQGGGPGHISTSEVYSIQEIIDEQRSHPGMARVGLIQKPNEVLNSRAPTSYTALVKGYNQCRIYSDENNYALGWTANPAWCATEYITNPLWGRGRRYGWEHINLPSFLRWAAYCDELIPDGEGGLAPRARFGLAFDSVLPADENIQLFGEGCGVRIAWRANQWVAILDEAEEPIWVGGQGNIVQGTFRLEPVTPEKRANRVDVFFQDEAMDFVRDSVTATLPDLAPGSALVIATRELRGCFRRLQAQWMADRLALHNKHATETVELEAGPDSLRVTLGSVFGVSTVTAGIGIASGRILAVDSTQTVLEIDEEVTLEAGKVYEVALNHRAHGYTVKRVANAPGATTRLLVPEGQWSAALQVGDSYALGEFDASRSWFRCTSSSLTPRLTRKLGGLLYSPIVYTGDLAAPVRPTQNSIPDPRKLPPDVTDLILLERSEYGQDGSLDAVIDVEWTPPISAVLGRFDVFLRPVGSSAWALRGSSPVGRLELRGGLDIGTTYQVAVVSVSRAEARKPPGAAPSAQITLRGVLTQPTTPAGLVARIIDGTLSCKVDPIPLAELGPSGFYEWRLGPSWNSSRLLEKTREPELERKSYPRGVFTILVRTRNSVGNYSAGVASTSIELRGQVDENIVLTEAQEPGWAGTLLGFVVEGGTNKLALYEPLQSVQYNPIRNRLRRAGRWRGFGAPDPLPIVRLEGHYTTPTITVSGGDLAIFRPDVAVDFEAIYIGLGDFAGATFSFGSPEAQIPFSGNEADKVTIRTDVRWSTTTDTEGAYSAWEELRDRGEIEARYVQFRLRAFVEADAYSVKIVSMVVSIDLPDKELNGRATAASANPVTVTYPSGYFAAVERLLVTIIGGAVGDTFRITADDKDGFTLTFYDNAGSITTGAADFSARGY